MTVLCTGGQAHVANVGPFSGYRVTDYESGPAREIRVVLLYTDNKSEIKARCDNGTPLPKIRESRQ
ncbi:hypothetical protein ACLQ29_34740 [Micromonospora sp. DT228]|uniref:hypothetical protein n=1 Tax=Micromonospora sp. DT228 TaxID=3393443 RepID=UPI003CFA8750